MGRILVFCLSLALVYQSKLFALGWYYYRVSLGDCLEKIARRYSVTVGQLAKWNHLADTNSIYVGQQLRILREREFVLMSPEEDRPNFVKPVNYWKVLRSYSNSLEEPYYGVLLLTPKDSWVKAAEAGVVVRIGPIRGYGNCIFVDHGGGWLTMYSHLTDIQVNRGDKVQKQTKLGQAGKGKLFFTVSYAGKPLNPLELL